MPNLTGDRRQFLATLGAVTVMPAFADSRSVTVKTNSGVVRGRIDEDLNIFTGIPFGAPTGGAKRFCPPQPVKPWAGVLDATQPAKVPPQPTNFLFPDLPGLPSEDCLQLNVWAPTKPGRYPVMVWIYGGGNIQGSCVESLYDGTPFAREGIVVVNFNYRLGVLGLLELGEILGPTYQGSGNNAMQDQLLALNWVKHNIAAFGGDPEQVTVAGQSAGAANIVALLAAPASKGLFQRAIISSGLQGTISLDTANAFARRFVTRLGGADHLTEASFEELLEAQGNAFEVWPNELPFRAIAGLPNLPHVPIDAVKAGQVRDVDLLIGWCHDESPPLIPEAAASDAAYVPKTNPADRPRIQRLMSAYAKADPTLLQQERVWRAASAEIFVLPSQRLADAQAMAGGQVRTYRLDYSVKGGPFPGKTLHGFDVTMAFKQLSSSIGKFFGFSSADEPMAARIHGIWSAFVRGEAIDAGLPAWPAYEVESRQTMILDRTSRVECDPAKFDREVWEGA